MPYPTKPKGGWQWPRQVVVNKSTAQIREKKATQKFEKQIQGNLSEQYGRRPERSPGTILLPRRGQNICLPSVGDDTRHTEEPAFRENAKGLQSRRHRTPEKYY